MNLEKLNTKLSIITAIIAILGASYGVFHFSKSTLRSHTLEHDQAFTGCWTNDPEGCIDCKQHNENIIYLDIEASNGNIEGVLDASHAWLDKVDPQDPMTQIYLLMFGNLTIRGERKGSEAKLDITDWRGGEMVSYGHAEIALKDNQIYWHLLEGHPTISKQTQLYQISQNDDCKPSP